MASVISQENGIHASAKGGTGAGQNTLKRKST
jgi:hypothetical protein